MAHVLCEALVDYPCTKDGRPHVAGRGQQFELHARAALTAQKRGKLRIVGPSKNQMDAIKARAKRLGDKAAAKAQTAEATDNAKAMAARFEQLERRVAKAEAKTKK